MAAYLLNCTCGNQIPVEVGQAGGQAACTCGRMVDVPPLRQLRHLPQQRAEEKATGRAWGTRQAWTAASLIVALVLFAWGAWNKYRDPSMPKFDPAARMKIVDEHLKTPAGAWESWIGYYKPMAERGLPLFTASNVHLIEQELANRRFFRGMLWTVAGLFALAAISVMFWPATVTKRGR